MEARYASVMKYHPARLVPRLAAPPIPGGELLGNDTLELISDLKLPSILGFSQHDKTNLDSSALQEASQT